MEPFTIQCTTCQSRIRVKNPKMIGQLANCPKCSSMIMVAPPQQITVETPGTPSVDSMAMTKDGIPSDFLQANEDSQPTNSDDEYRLAPAEADGDLSAADEHSDPQEAPEVENWEPDDQPLLPTDSWTSEKNTKTQQVLLVGFLSVAGIGLCIVGFLAFLNWYNATPDPGTVTAGGEPQTGAAEASVQQDDEPTDAQPNSEPSSPEASGDQGSGTEDVAATPEDGVASNHSTNDSSDSNSEPDNTPEPSTAETQQSIDELFQQAGGLDSGPDELPNTLSPDSLSPEAGDNLVDGDTSSIPDALKALKAMEDIVGYSPQVSLPADSDVEPGAPPVTAAELGLESVGARPPIPAVDYNQRSQFTLDGLSINKNDVPAESINLWVQLSGLPTLLDFDVLAAANRNIADLRFEIRTDGNQSIQELGQAFAASGGLVASPVQNRFVAFSLPEPKVTEVLPNAVALDGIVDSISGDTEQEKWLNENLGRLLPGSEGAWQLQNGLLTYDSSRVDALSWFRVIRLLENWKLQKGIQSSNQSYDLATIQQPFLVAQQFVGLDTKLSRISVQAEPVGQTLSRVAADAKINCWIDWPVVASVGLGPMTEDLAITLNRTVKEVLTDYCDRYSLIAAILDDKSIWLTTQGAYRMQTRFYVLPSEGKTPEQWEEALRPLTPVSANGIGRVVVVPTPDRKFVLVRCCRPKIDLSL